MGCWSGGVMESCREACCIPIQVRLEDLVAPEHPVEFVEGLREGGGIQKIGVEIKGYGKREEYAQGHQQ